MRLNRDTGRLHITRLVSVADVGQAVNPHLVEAQEMGASMQGLGNTLFEEMVFDGRGQPAFFESFAPVGFWVFERKPHINARGGAQKLFATILRTGGADKVVYCGHIRRVYHKNLSIIRVKAPPLRQVQETW